MDDEERRQLELEIEQRVRQELEASIDQRLEDQLNQRFQALNLLVGQGNSAQAGDEAGQGVVRCQAPIYRLGEQGEELPDRRVHPLCRQRPCFCQPGALSAKELDR